MRILRSIVAPSATLVAFYDSKMIDCGGIRSQLICDELVWDKAIFLQQLAHQFKRRLFVPPSLDQHVEDLAFGVDGAPQIDHPAIDFQIDFVQMPSRMGFGPAFAQVRCDHRPEMVHPAPDGLIGVQVSIGDSPDAPGSSANIGAFPAFLQRKRELRTATSTSGSPHGGRGSDLAIFPWHWDTPLPSVALERPIEHVTLALVVAAAAVPR
jgi:hypothetical protein